MKPIIFFLSIVFLLSSCSSDNPKPVPVIDSFSPDKGIPGTIVTISGSNFSAVKSENSVMFGGDLATVNSATTSQLVVVVPNSGKTAKILVTVNGLMGTSENTFTVFEYPTVTSFAPESGEAGSSVTITGTSFSSVLTDNQVKIGGVEATITAATPTAITFTVPAEAMSGKITLTSNGLTTITNQSFIVKPVISNVSPISAATGSIITITGTGLSGSSQVLFNGFGAQIYSQTANELKVFVPSLQTPASTATIQVTDGASSLTYSTPFTYVSSWVRKKDFPGLDRQRAISFSIGSKAYFGLGTPSSGTNIPFKDVWEYDPSNDTWTQKNDFVGDARYGAFSFALNGKGYIGSGRKRNSDATYVNLTDTWSYDPVTDLWSPRADFPGVGRTSAGTFVIGDKGYVGTGFGETTLIKLKDFWEYNSGTNSWTPNADFGGDSRGGSSAFSVGTKGYLGGGETTSLANANEFWEFDTSSNAWTKIFPRPIGGSFAEHVGFAINDIGYVGYSTIYYKILPGTPFSVQVDSPPNLNSTSSKAVVINGKAYVLRGTELWEFTPPTN